MNSNELTYSRYSVAKWREQFDQAQGCVFFPNMRDMIKCSSFWPWN